MSAEPEFVSLRQEILQCFTNIITMTTFVMTATGVSLAASFEYLNPIAALFPLFVLYLGNVVVFNNVRTVTVIGAYFRVFWEEENKEYHWETRQAIRRSIEGEEIKTRVKHSNRREEWMGPLAQRMFFITGYLCIGVYLYVSLTILLSQLSTDLLLPYPYSLYVFPIKCGFFSLFLLVSFVFWTRKWLLYRQLTDPVHGSNSLMKQSTEAWNQVKGIESATKVPRRKSRSANAA
jgi:hypothetical protein